MNTTSSSNRRLGLIAAVLTGLSWSVLAIFLEYALVYTDSMTIAAYRMVFSFIALFLYFLFFRRQDMKVLTPPPRGALIAGAFLAVNYVGYMKGIELTSPSNAQILIQLAPATLVLAGMILFKERPYPLQILGLALTGVGLYFFFSDQLSESQGNRDSFVLGNIWLVIGALTWTGFAIFQKSLSRFWSSSQLNLVIFAVSSVILLPFIDWQNLLQLNLFQHLWLCFLGINTLFSYACLGIALQKAPASEVSPIITANPLLTLIFMKILEHFSLDWLEPEHISFWGYFGAVVLVIGVILAVMRPERRSKHKSEQSPRIT